MYTYSYAQQRTPIWPSQEQVSDPPYCVLSFVSLGLFSLRPLLSEAPLPISYLSLSCQSSHLHSQTHPGQEMGASGSPTVWWSREGHPHCKVTLGINRQRLNPWTPKFSLRPSSVLPCSVLDLRMEFLALSAQVECSPWSSCLDWPASSFI